MILSAGVVPLRKRNDTWELLLLRCFKYWDFPKGECHQGEDPLKSALRELQEETSIANIEMPWHDKYYETGPYSKGKVARYYIGIAAQDQIVVLLPNPENGIIEHHEYRWVSFEEAKKLANPRIIKVIEWVGKQIDQG